MKNCGNWSVQLLATALFAGLSSGMFFAAGAPSDEHAGYQGIPVRNGLNRGLIQHEDVAVAQRYPSLPRRKNEADLARAESVEARNQRQNSSAPERAGYGGIPLRNGPNPNETEATWTPQTASIEHAGYGGIPQPSVTDRVMKRSNSFSTKRASALVKAK